MSVIDWLLDKVPVDPDRDCYIEGLGKSELIASVEIEKGHYTEAELSINAIGVIKGEKGCRIGLGEVESEEDIDDIFTYAFNYEVHADNLSKLFRKWIKESEMGGLSSLSDDELEEIAVFALAKETLDEDEYEQIKKFARLI